MEISLSNISSIISSMILLFFGFWYAYKIVNKSIKPALSTWLIMLTGSGLSLVTFLVASDGDWLTGLLNIADLMTTVIILVPLIIKYGFNTAFRPFEKWYMVAAGIIVLFWAISQNAFASNLLIQLLIMVAYFPTIHKLITEKKNSESFFAWGVVLFSSAFGLYPAVNSGNALAVVFVGRTFLMVIILMGLMFYFDRVYIYEKKPEQQIV